MGVAQRMGMRAEFQSWLSMKKGLTLTKYNKLATEAKASVYKEYKDEPKQPVRKAA